MKKILLLSLFLVEICSTQIQLNANTITPSKIDIGNFFKAIGNGDINTVSLMLDKFKGIANAPSNDDIYYHPLLAAVNAKTPHQNDIVKALIKHGADLNYSIISHETYKSTPLISAIAEGSADIVQVLIKAKADVNTINLSLWDDPSSKETALDVAVKYKSKDPSGSIIKILKNDGAKTAAELHK